MTWSASFSGHYQRADGTWDAELEQKVAEVFKEIIDKLKEFGLSSALFNGNHYNENFLIPKGE